MNRIARLVTASAAASCFGMIVAVGTAAAHIESDPAAVAAGSAATVGFGVEHGCEDSNTTMLAIEVPAGITDASPVDKPGWTTAVDGATVTFSGGNLDAHTADSFELTFTAPTEPGTIHFPIVQTCEVGELAWIEIPAEGAAEPERPAPAVLVTDGEPTADQLSPHDEDAAGTEEETGATHDETAETASTGGGSAATTTPAVSVPIATTVSTSSTASDDDDDSSNTGLVVGIVVAAVIVIGGAALLAARRRSSTSK